MKNLIHLLSTYFILLFTNLIFSQTAPVQIIHNSADLTLNTVDIYLDGTILIDDLAFRSATPFLDLPAGNLISIGIAPGNSTSSSESFFNISTTLDTNETYIMVGNGIVSASGYSPNEPFALSIFPQGRKIATNPLNTDVLFCHGGTDTGSVDIVNTTVLPISKFINNLSYTSFNSNYLDLTTSNYTIDVTDVSGNRVVRSYDFFLERLNLQGQAITVVSNGFLNRSQNSNGASYGLWIALASGGSLIELVQSNYARVQILHNSADLSIATVDLYVNNKLVKDNFAFRSSTPYLDLDASVPVRIDIAPSNSTSSAESIYNFTTTFTIGETYILVANGVLSTTGYSPSIPLNFSVFNKGRETSFDSINTDILIYHGATDAPTIDIVETDVPLGTLANDISYSSFSSDYIELPTADYAIDVRAANGNTVLKTYSGALQTLGLNGASLTIVASGFLNPTQNSDCPEFGLWVAGVFGGDMIPLQLYVPTPKARVQIIHNSADAANRFVDVYLNGQILINDFNFRTASKFINIPAETPITISVAPSSSTSDSESFYTFTETLTNNKKYIIVANGNTSTSGYTPNQPFGFSIFDQGREIASNTGNTDILVNHGATDAPIVDIVETSVPAGTIVDNISYNSFNSNYLELPTEDFTLNVTDTNGTTVLKTYLALFESFNFSGKALTIVASGFLDPSQNNNGPEFGLWVATSLGGNMIPLQLKEQIFTSRVQIIHNSPDAANALVDVYLNGEILLDDFKFRTATEFMDVPAETTITISIAPSTSTSDTESFYTFTETLASDKTYVMVANGITSTTGYTPNQPFGLSIFDQGREIASNTGNTDILISHGATDAPIVDIIETSIPAGTIVDDISYNSFNSNYLELSTANYVLDVRDITGINIIASYSAPLATLNLQGQALTVVASGFIDSLQNSSGSPFGLWAALASGGDLIELENANLKTEGFSNNMFTIFPNPVSSILNISIPKDKKIYGTRIVDATGRTIKNDTLVKNNSIDISNLSNGIYMLSIEIDGGNYNKKFIVRK
ncbi:DUF4397 domain-containing protein [Flavobacterium luteum]|uniref:DUF4397 domain-containing protein n=1 Tax=Flavobacterium luteum TaxID=2026654 RepID=A0A7J5AKR0_9FLAO|nr:DUF4397 domain-containing protein [Flavobacterium luteum]KAB1158181.1 DUF4397 domain-containing protein [Flavobacterium luteum]